MHIEFSIGWPELAMLARIAGAVGAVIVMIMIASILMGAANDSYGMRPAYRRSFPTRSERLVEFGLVLGAALCANAALFVALFILGVL
jgi:hypothetical protein